MKIRDYLNNVHAAGIKDNNVLRGDLVEVQEGVFLPMLAIDSEGNVLGTLSAEQITSSVRSSSLDGAALLIFGDESFNFISANDEDETEDMYSEDETEDMYSEDAIEETDGWEEFSTPNYDFTEAQAEMMAEETDLEISTPGMSSSKADVALIRSIEYVSDEVELYPTEVEYSHITSDVESSTIDNDDQE